MVCEIMQSGIEEDFIIIKLSHNENVQNSISGIAENYNIKSGLILTGIGMIKDFELGYFKPSGYKISHFEPPHELISMSGSIAYAIDDPKHPISHIHCSVADQNHHVFGGHLHKATVNIINEITIKRLNDLNLKRIRNNETGLMELNIETKYTY